MKNNNIEENSRPNSHPESDNRPLARLGLHISHAQMLTKKISDVNTEHTEKNISMVLAQIKYCCCKTHASDKNKL